MYDKKNASPAIVIIGRCNLLDAWTSGQYGSWSSSASDMLLKVESPQKMLDLSFWRDDVVIHHQNSQFCNNGRACPNNFTEVKIFSFGSPDWSTNLVLDVLSSQK